MLRKHLSQYSGEELRAEIKRHVDEQIQENKKLDYKETVSLDDRRGRREAAKDISSFANEIGGCVVYGVPEKERTLPDGTKIVVPDKPYGMEAVSGFEERFEDTCAETICPHLPDLQIRKVNTEYDDKVVYVVWHPESWMAPHMIQAYNDHSYYKRGLRRAIKMSEHEVRQKYAQVQDYLDRVREFIESPEVNFYAELSEGSKTHFVCCPLMVVPDRVDFTSSQMRRWLDGNLRMDRYHGWRPSYHGMCSSRESASEPLTEEIFCELHRNGAVNYFEHTYLLRPEKLEPPLPADREMFVSVHHVLGRLDQFLTLCGSLCEEIGYYQPLALRLRITECSEFGFSFSSQRRFTRGEPITKYAIRGDKLQVDRLVSGAELAAEPRIVGAMMSERIFHAFGVRTG